MFHFAKLNFNKCSGYNSLSMPKRARMGWGNLEGQGGKRAHQALVRGFDSDIVCVQEVWFNLYTSEVSMIRIYLFYTDAQREYSQSSSLHLFMAI